MKVWTCKSLSGVYLNAQAVVVDDSREAAAVTLEHALKKAGLPQTVELGQLIELDLSIPGALILDNGDY